MPPDFNPPDIALKTYASTMAYGHVWSRLEDPYLPLPNVIDYDESRWKFGYGVPREVGCGMRQMTENFQDMAHFAFIHTGSMGADVRRVVDPYQVQQHAWELEWVLGTDLGGMALGVNGTPADSQVLSYRLALPMTIYVRIAFPDGRRRMVAQFATPITADGSRIRLFWLVGVDDTAAGEHGMSMPEVVREEQLIFDEDIPLVENQWPPEPPLDSCLQVHTRADRASLIYRRMYSDLLEAFAADSDLFPQEPAKAQSETFRTRAGSASS